MNKLNAIIIMVLCGLSACHSKTAEKQKPGTASEKPVAKQNNKREHVARMTFVKYVDDGDYFQLLASKDGSTSSFINETDSTRNLNRGDQIQVTWKDGTIIIPGDNDAEMPAQLIISIKKTGDGPVTAFRNEYGKKLRYTWSPDEELTYSVESRERNGRNYNVIGIAPAGPNGSNIVQWLYVGEENDRIYEYDLPGDKLVAFD